VSVCACASSMRALHPQAQLTAASSLFGNTYDSVQINIANPRIPTGVLTLTSTDVVYKPTSAYVCDRV
jgi:hypothetical protein